METPQYLDAIADQSVRLLHAAETAGLDAPVPSCPGWTVADLLGHVGTVQRWAAGMVETRATEMRYPDDVGRPEDPEALPGWVRAGADRLVAVIGATPPDTPVWTFPGMGTASFWYRRQAHEVTMHRVDAGLAAGLHPVVETDLALDGIDEFFDVVVAFRLRERMTGAGETVHLHCTDVEGEWLVRLTPDGPAITREHAKGDVAARGTASDLLLALRGRLDPSVLEVFGDAALLARFVDLARI